VALEEQRGQLITRLREERLWTREELAKRAGVSPTTVTLAETGRTHVRLSTIRKFADAPEVDPQQLLHPEELMSPKDVALPLDIDRLKQVVIKEVRPASLAELQTAVEDKIGQRYSDEELLEYVLELEEFRKALSPVKATRFDTYAKVVETENYVRRVLEKVAGRQLA
jgi:transcriptional regulator with XRE-family HTH domain